MGKDSAVEFNTGNKSLLGAFNGVRTFYAYGNVQLNARKVRGTKQVLGLLVINDREGSFINRSRLALMYAIHVPISQRATLNAGLAAGFINYFYKASNISAGGSAFAPNVDVGLWIHRPDFNIGISANQVIPSQLAPVDFVYTIDRFYNFNIDKSFSLGPYFSLTPCLVFRWQSEEYYTGDVGLIATIQDNLILALAYKYEQGASVSGGLEKVKLGPHILKMMFSYFSPIGNKTSYNPNAYEISLGFIPSRHKESVVIDEE